MPATELIVLPCSSERNLGLNQLCMSFIITEYSHSHLSGHGL